MQVKVFINNQQLTLTENESISITSSVLSIKDITKNTTDYSKTFTVVADENNNAIFKHYYNASIDDGFDARVTVKGHIELGGWVFRVGGFLLREVKVESGKAVAYVINFWGNLVSLKEVIGDKLLSEFNFSQFNHSYNSANVKLGLEDGLSSGDIIYNLLAKRRYYYNALSTDNTDTPKLTNIAYTSAGQNGVKWNDLRPSIRMIQIIQAIETDLGLVFSREFFGSATFRDLFMWLNDDANSKISGGQVVIDWNAGSTTYINQTTNIGTFSVDNKPRKWYRFSLRVTPEVGYENTEYTLRQFVSVEGAEYKETHLFRGRGTKNYESSIYPDDNREKPYYAYWTIESDQEFKAVFDNRQAQRNWFGETSAVFTNSAIMTIGSIFRVAENMPKIKAIDFLKGLFNAFKLVVVPQEDGTIYINTVEGYYSEGEVLDLTDFVNSKEITVTRGEVLNEIRYSFQQPSSILNLQFEKNTNKFYGNEQATLTSNDGELLNGDTIDLELPFEQIIYERLSNAQDGVITNIQYGAVISETEEPVNLKPHIFYNIRKSISGSAIGFKNDAGTKVSMSGYLNTPFHSNVSENPKNVFLFSQEFSTWDGSLMTETLYKKYHESYILDVFDIKARRYKISVVLPQRIVMALTLNDIIRIKYEYYRIDSFTVDLQTGNASLELFNTNNIRLNRFEADETDLFLQAEAHTYGVTVSNLYSYTFALVDKGFGTSWLTVSDNGDSVVEFAVTENTTANREAEVVLTKTGTLETITFSIYQYFNYVEIYSNPREGTEPV
jgi:hypothetical protein